MVPKGVAKKATERNRLKRKGTNIIKPLTFKKGSGIFFYRKTYKQANQTDLKEDIFSLLKKAKVLG